MKPLIIQRNALESHHQEFEIYISKYISSFLLLLQEMANP